MANLNDYLWKSMTARRSTSDVSWQYDISLHGSSVIPPMFRQLLYQPDSSHLAMMGDAVEPVIDYDYPSSSVTITAYSYGYYLRNPVLYWLRESRAGVDIPSWARWGSNYQGETKRSDEIKSYENPTYHLIRMLWPVLDRTGEITSPRGYYNLYPAVTELVPNWGLGMSKAVKLTQTAHAGQNYIWVNDLSVFPDPATGTRYLALFSYSDSDSDATYDEGEEVTGYETVRYTGKSATSGAGYLWLATPLQHVWNPSNGAVKYLDPGFNPSHPAIEKKQFFFTGGDTIADVLEKYAEHCQMLYYTKFFYVSGEWREYLYWIPKYKLDENNGSYLGFDTSIRIISPTTATLIGSPGLSATIGLEDSYNAVQVEACRMKDSMWFYGFAQRPEVSSIGEIYRILLYRTDSLLPDTKANTWTTTVSADTYYGPFNPSYPYGAASYGTYAENMECQRLVDQKAKELLKYANYQIQTYTCSFKDTYFDLYQRLQFTGFANIPSDVMRITDIQYEYAAPGEGPAMVCTITCANAETLQKSGKFQSVIDEIQANYAKLKDSASASSDSQKMGVVISTYQDNTMATVQMRSTGVIIKRRSYGLRKAPA